jgi:hypothetical protein
MITNGISTKGTFYKNKTKSKISKYASGGDYGDLEPSLYKTHMTDSRSASKTSSSSIYK